MSPCHPVDQNSDARDMAAAAVKAPMMEPELGSTPAAFEKEGADRVVVGETNRAVEGLGGLMRTVQLPQQVSANGPVRLVGDHRTCIDLIQQPQSGLSSVDFGMRGRACHGSADGWRELRQLIIESGDGGPIRAPSAGALGMHRLNRRLDLESPQARMSRRHRELTLGLVDQGREPKV